MTQDTRISSDQDVEGLVAELRAYAKTGLTALDGTAMVPTPFQQTAFKAAQALSVLQARVGELTVSQSQPCAETGTHIPSSPDDQETSAADETAWLIEETWSGYVHYVHRDFRCDKLATEWRQNEWRQSYGASARHTQPMVTKNVEEAMRFPTQSAAELWLALQPRWMSLGGQYQIREHMWPAPAIDWKARALGAEARVGELERDSFDSLHAIQAAEARLAEIEQAAQDLLLIDKVEQALGTEELASVMIAYRVIRQLASRLNGEDRTREEG